MIKIDPADLQIGTKILIKSEKLSSIYRSGVNSTEAVILSKFDAIKNGISNWQIELRFLDKGWLMCDVLEMEAEFFVI